MLRALALLVALASVSAQADDARLIATYRAGMRSLVDEARLPRANVPILEEREEARAVWKSFLDYQIALETIRNRHDDFPRLRGAARDRAFRLYHAAWLAQYRGALDFIVKVERHPEIHTILNESVSSLGLPADSYATFKLHWLHLQRAAEWAYFKLLGQTFGGAPLEGAMDDAKSILEAGVGSGPVETLRNGARILAQAAWNPLPEAIEAAAGGPASPAPRPSFIAREQIAAVRQLVAPGDLLFERRDWSLTNVGLPGFWPHVALYIGTPAERRRSFGDAFEERLRAHDPAGYETLVRGNVIEAVGENVIVTTFEKSADADYFAVIRPRLPEAAKAEAVVRAFGMLGRPYDFEFDFVTDDRIVCSELIYKAYEQRLDLPVMRYAGRSVTPPNDFVRWFDEHYDSAERRADFVAFIDGHAHDKRARVEDVGALRRSWRRPRWHPIVHRD